MFTAPLSRRQGRTTSLMSTVRPLEIFVSKRSCRFLPSGFGHIGKK